MTALIVGTILLGFLLVQLIALLFKPIVWLVLIIAGIIFCFWQMAGEILKENHIPEP